MQGVGRAAPACANHAQPFAAGGSYAAGRGHNRRGLPHGRPTHLLRLRGRVPPAHAQGRARASVLRVQADDDSGAVDQEGPQGELEEGEGARRVEEQLQSTRWLCWRLCSWALGADVNTSVHHTAEEKNVQEGAVQVTHFKIGRCILTSFWTS